jgi:hypothetical protein
MTHEKNIRTIISSWWTQLRTQDSLMTVEKIIASDDGNKQKWYDNDLMILISLTHPIKVTGWWWWS